MNFLVNDRSIHGQFRDAAAFREALGAMMTIRAVLARFGRALHCHRNLLHAQLGPGLNLQQAVQALPREMQGAVMAWMTRHGPFWEDLRQHGPDDWFEWRNEVVTETALGEAAFASLHGIERRLISFSPSDFTHQPVEVEWVRDGGTTQVQVPNHWEPIGLQRFLDECPRPIDSWADLELMVRARFTGEVAAGARPNSLVVAKNAFEPLDGHPFVPAAAERFVFLLLTLERLHRCYDTEGNRTWEGHEIYQNFFTGKKGEGGRGALFTDSSDSEKNTFREQLTFGHPEEPATTLFCPWHGKVQTPQYRMHFSYPVRADRPIYVVYLGPKITKR